MYRTLSSIAGVMLVIGLLTVSARGEEPLKRAGTIATVGAGSHVIGIDVMGPWLRPDTKPVRYVIAVPADAAVSIVTRANVDAAEWRGGYVEKSADRAEMRPGDFVVVTFHREHGRLVATNIEIVRLPEAPAS